MKRAIVLAMAVTLVGTAAIAATYEWNKPTSSDPFDNTLRQYHFRGIHPPSNLLTVGSLYYVDAAGVYTTICPAQKPDLDGQVMVSRTWDLEEQLKQDGRLSMEVTIDLRAVLKGYTENSYTQTVHTSLSDVVLEEIPLANNLRIMRKLMNDPDCKSQVRKYVEAGNYVCQGQKTLQATAQFKLGSDVQDKLANEANLTPDEIKRVVKQAIESRINESLVIREDRVFASSEPLKFGIQVNPTCLSPGTARFERTLPDTSFDRMVNFVMLHIIEPLFPAVPTEVTDDGDAAVRIAGL
jgi:hypothetical protein